MWNWIRFKILHLLGYAVYQCYWCRKIKPLPAYEVADLDVKKLLCSEDCSSQYFERWWEDYEDYVIQQEHAAHLRDLRELREESDGRL